MGEQDKIQNVTQSAAEDQSPDDANQMPDKETGVNANQITYDMPDQTDGVVEVRELSFQLRKLKHAWKEKEAPEPYTVNSGGTMADVLKRCEEKYKKELDARKYRNLRVEPYENVKDVQKLKAGDRFKILWEEEVQMIDKDGNPEYEYYRIKETKIQKDVIVSARCTGDSGILKIKIRENLMGNKELVFDDPVKFLDGDTEKNTLEFKLDGRMIYDKEVKLRPKSDDDLKTIRDRFNKRAKQTAFLYFEVEVTDTEDEVKYNRNKQEFLNEEDERLMVHNRQVCPVDPAIRSHFVIHSTAGAMSKATIEAIQSRNKGHKYVMDDGSVIEKWPFTEKDVGATKSDKSTSKLRGQMFHVELNYKAGGEPSDAQYDALADLYIEASDIEDCWPIIVPHIEIDRGIPDGHMDPENFDYNKFYQILMDKNIPIDSIPHFDHDRYWRDPDFKKNKIGDLNSWPPVLTGDPRKVKKKKQ